MTFKETLKTLKKPVDYLDEQVLRQYTKIARKVEEEGKSIRNICLGLDASVPLAISSAGPLFGLPSSLLYIFPVSVIIGLDTVVSDRYNHAKKLESLGLKDYKTEQTKKITRFARLPMLTVGTYYLANSFNAYYEAIFNDQSIGNSPFETSLGLGLILMASSIYLKDSDPRLLEKKPLWKRTYDKIKQKIADYSSAPALAPIPVQEYTLESKLHS